MRARRAISSSSFNAIRSTMFNSVPACIEASVSRFVLQMFLFAVSESCKVVHNLSGIAGCGKGRLAGHGSARFHGGIRRHRSPRSRCAGAGRAGSAGLSCGGAGRQGGVGSTRAGAGGADRLGARAAGAPHHRQSRAGRSAEGRQPLRSADRARTDGSDRGNSSGRDFRLHRAGRTRARRLDCSRCRRAARGDRRECQRRGPDLPEGLRAGSRMG